MKLVLLR
ncbi:hypothetical protein BpHYR1_013327 [Brachionus plicatilis]|nr:hypothetical protein BpHYR1_013327 [Brachionus plicatilis]